MPTTKADPTGLTTNSNVNDLSKAAFNGHSTENGNYAADGRYGAIGLKVGIQAVEKIGEFLSKSAGAAAAGIEEGVAGCTRGVA